MGIYTIKPSHTGLYVSVTSRVPKGPPVNGGWPGALTRQRGVRLATYESLSAPRHEWQGRLEIFYVEGTRKGPDRVFSREGFVVQGGLYAQFVEYRPHGATGESASVSTLSRIWNGLSLEGDGSALLLAGDQGMGATDNARDPRN